jgi:predicted enzyme related to lactoylglutathione lyase
MKINGIDAIYYFAHDFNRARAFYVGMIGSEPETSVADSFCEWTLPSGEAFGLIKGTRYRQCNGVLFNVSDVKASVTELQRRGVKFEDDGEIEETPVCYMAFGEDTEGNGFILHQRK